MANVLRGIVALLEVTAVLNAASIDEKLADEDPLNNLGKAASPELAEDTATVQNREFTKDRADVVES